MISMNGLVGTNQMTGGNVIDGLFDLYYRIKFGIKIHRNVLTEEERLGLIKDSNKYLIKFPISPNLQSEPDLHKKLNEHSLKSIQKLLDKIGFTSILSCWSTYIDPIKVEGCWHKHAVNLTSIYYMENPESLGTVFRVDNKEFRIDVPTNTLVVIPGYIDHNGPMNVTKPRESLVIDTDE